jgi:mono/diheme cytochrome c family protein
MDMKKFVIAFVLVLFLSPVMAPADGGLDYKAKCAACHGPSVNSVPRTARLLKADPRKLALKTSSMNREEMIAIAEKGKDKMPSFEKELTKDQIGAIIDYVMAQKNK